MSSTLSISIISIVLLILLLCLALFLSLFESVYLMCFHSLYSLNPIVNLNPDPSNLNPRLYLTLNPYLYLTLNSNLDLKS